MRNCKISQISRLMTVFLELNPNQLAMTTLSKGNTTDQVLNRIFFLIGEISKK